MKISVLDVNNLSVVKDTFSGRVNQDVIHQAVVKYQASLRQGNASTKERSEVSGGGRKPYKQKGTGRARAGSSRSPLWSGGGVTFGPHPRDFSYSIPKKIKICALREGIKAKINSQDIVCVKDFLEEYKKTKEFVKVLDDLNLKGKILLIVDKPTQSIKRVTNNIMFLTLICAKDVNVYDLLKNNKVLIVEKALIELVNRINGEVEAVD